MLKILRAYGILNRIVSAIATMYENTRAKVITPDGETEPFNILAGVLQGDMQEGRKCILMIFQEKRFSVLQ